MNKKLVSAALLAVTIAAPVVAGETTIGIAATRAEIENTRLDTGFKLFLNAMLTENVGLEVAHGQYGELGYVDFSATNFAFVAATTGKTVSFYGKAGLSFWDADMSSYYYGDESVNGEDLLVGFGLNIKPGDAARIRFEIEAIDADGENVTSINLGFGVAF